MERKSLDITPLGEYAALGLRKKLPGSFISWRQANEGAFGRETNSCCGKRILLSRCGLEATVDESKAAS
jgi:hypothetical protein